MTLQSELGSFPCIVVHGPKKRPTSEQVVIWVDYKPVNVEIDDDNTGIVRVFEIRIGMNEFDHRMMIIFFSAV